MIETLRAVLSLQATLLLLVLAGAAGKKLGVITAGFQNGLSRFLVYMVLPCSVLNAFSKGNTVGIWEQSLQILAVMSAVHVFYILLNLLLYRRKSPGRGAVLRFAVLCPNTNFMGMPVIGGIFGETGTLLLSVALFPVRVFILTVGISYFVIGRSGRWVIHLFKNPAVWAVFLGAAMLLLEWQLPAPAERAVSALSACTTPLSMILIGGVVGNLKKEMLRDLEVWKFCLLRLILIPMALLLALRPLPLDPVVCGVAVVMSALPTGAMTVIYTKEYEKDEDFAAACVVFSTLLSVLTIPVVNLASISLF